MNFPHIAKVSEYPYCVLQIHVSKWSKDEAKLIMWGTAFKEVLRIHLPLNRNKEAIRV